MKSAPAAVSPPSFGCKINEASMTVLTNNKFSLTVSIVDEESQNVVQDISWNVIILI